MIEKKGKEKNTAVLEFNQNSSEEGEKVQSPSPLMRGPDCGYWPG